MTMAVLALVIGASATLFLLGCGSGGGSSDMVGPAEDIVLFSGGADDAKLIAPVDKEFEPNHEGINLGTSGYFHALDVYSGNIDNHYFMTKSGVSYQVEVIAEGADTDVDLYLGRSSRPYSNGEWKSSTRSYPLMDGVVFKSAQDGMMYVDVRGITTGGPHGPVSYHVHVRKCQFGTYSQ